MRSSQTVHTRQLSSFLNAFHGVSKRAWFLLRTYVSTPHVLSQKSCGVLISDAMVSPFHPSLDDAKPGAEVVLQHASNFELSYIDAKNRKRKQRDRAWACLR